jgi:hypothetical protein
VKSFAREAGQNFFQISGHKNWQTNTQRIPTVLVGIPWLTPTPETAGGSKIFDLGAGFAKAIPPSKMSISCGFP